MPGMGGAPGMPGELPPGGDLPVGGEPGMPPDVGGAPLSGPEVLIRQWLAEHYAGENEPHGTGGSLPSGGGASGGGGGGGGPAGGRPLAHPIRPAAYAGPLGYTHVGQHGGGGEFNTGHPNLNARRLRQISAPLAARAMATGQHQHH
jgi:hypothetical protein